ncbi:MULTISPECIES: nucleopolyhedrovirus P10 family protein [unclassified Streptomyces]|uniref:nucleopolyhedrovirus P10 family protein n=1 Tax=unclassified Streptomyces TaxID=2593676 RepID=UPI0011CE1C72|nr:MULTISPECIES: nucleopolyhedrovirus P10 family protein [unclassified Streptomyces]TXS79811.1 nucleopolyhedrovirus P10 family protein [Streptomyces sp. me109]
MTADRWTRAVVRQLGLGRLLPLGHRGDGAWITEEAARTVLRRAADAVPGVRVGALRVSLADPGRTYEPAVPPPPGALPPGPLRVTGEFAASADPSAPGGEPLPAVAARLRSALGTAATERLGLMVTEVDLRVTALLDTGTPAPLSGPGPSSGSDPADGSEPADGWNQADGLTPAGGPDPVAGPGAVDEPVSSEAARVAAAVLSVPGVDRLAGALGRPVHFAEVRATDLALPRRHVRVEVAVSAAERAADVARAVRVAVAETLPDVPSVTVLVTAVR